MASEKPIVVFDSENVFILQQGMNIYVKTADICSLMGVSNQWIGQLVSQGTLNKVPTDYGKLFNLTDSVKNYMDSLSEKVKKTDVNPRWLVENFTGEKPGIYLACGREDDLFPSSQLFHKLLTDAGFEHHYVEDEGNHDWDYWDRHIKLALQWLPLDERVGGLNSGNIKGE